MVTPPLTSNHVQKRRVLFILWILTPSGTYPNFQIAQIESGLENIYLCSLYLAYFVNKEVL